MKQSCISFNKINVASYLEKCWQVVTSNSEINTIKTVFHHCSGHIMHHISYNIDKNFKQKITKVLDITCNWYEVKSRDLQQINQIFESLCYIIHSQVISPELKRLIKGELELNYYEAEPLDEESQITENCETYREHHHMVDIAIKAITNVPGRLN